MGKHTSQLQSQTWRSGSIQESKQWGAPRPVCCTINHKGKRMSLHTIDEVNANILSKTRRDALLQSATDNIAEGATWTATCSICTLNVELLDHLILNCYPCVDSEVGAAQEHLSRYLGEDCANRMEKDSATAWAVAGDAAHHLALPTLSMTVLPSPCLLYSQGKWAHPEGIIKQGVLRTTNTGKKTDRKTGRKKK